MLGEFDEKKNEGYADVDMGEKIDYVGTALKHEEGDLGPTNEVDEHMNNPTRGTRDLMPENPLL